MPVHIKTEMPNKQSRIAILRAQLKKESLEENFDFESIAEQTENCSGSDLREVVRVAILQRAKDVTANYRDLLLNSKANTSLNSNHKNGQSLSVGSTPVGDMRPLQASDFEFALKRTQKAVSQAGVYNDEVSFEDFGDK
jgi:SpoVK/Ycf46/Vps4 family AAA+-type ATPase